MANLDREGFENFQINGDPLDVTEATGPTCSSVCLEL